MGFTKSLFRLAAVAAIVVLAAGCLTERRPLQLQDRPFKTETYEEITATVRFVDEAILKAKYKEEVNPFLTDYNKIHFRRLVVFEVLIKNGSAEALLFLTNRLELQYGKADQPYNRFQLGQHWEFQDEDEGTKAIHKSRREKIIQQMVLPNSYTIQAGGIMKGYVVFVGSMPSYGSAKVYVPLFKSERDEYHRFEFPFEF
jgi:hypothetical protein